ncbi:MAG: gliding motility-associated C-terminal domain-containing protein [Bacteroidales bacterium]
MNLRKYIISLSLLLAAWMTPVLGQDYVAVVCAGDTGMTYFVQGNEGSTFDWTISGGTITRFYGDSIIVDWGDVPGEYEISVLEISPYGCRSVPSAGKVLITAPEFDLGDDTYICEGELFSLSYEDEFRSILWSDGSTSADFTTSSEGLITCTVVDQYGCSASDELFLEVKPVPYVDLGADTSLCGEEWILLDAGNEGINYEWSTGSIGQEILIYQGAQMISVVVEDEYGCTGTDTLVIEKCDPSEYFRDIPTAITPSNQDGRNDYWELRKLQSYPNAVVDIYDRWGRLVWRSEPGYPEPWDGRNMNGRMVPMDSYHFVILLNFGDDDRVVGSVTVIR